MLMTDILGERYDKNKQEPEYQNEDFPGLHLRPGILVSAVD